MTSLIENHRPHNLCIHMIFIKINECTRNNLAKVPELQSFCEMKKNLRAKQSLNCITLEYESFVPPSLVDKSLS